MPIRPTLPRIIAVLAVLALLQGVALLISGYGQYKNAYRDLVAKDLTPPPAGAPDALALDVYHNQLAWEFAQTMAAAPPDIVYFNDSVMGGHTDAESRATMAEMLAECLGRSVYPVSGAGYTPVLFREYADLLSVLPGKPRLVIFSINLRSFSDEWFFTPRWLYSRAALFTRLLARPPRFGEYLGYLFSPVREAGDFLVGRRTSPQADHAAYFTAHGDRVAALKAIPADGLDPSQQAIRAHFIENYMIGVDRSHPMLAGAVEAAKAFKAAGVAVLPYLTPVDVEEGTRLVGPEFAARIDESARAVMEALAEGGAPGLDLSRALGTEYFVDRDYACEHLDLAGRRRVAGWLAEAAVNLLRAPVNR